MGRSQPGPSISPLPTPNPTTSTLGPLASHSSLAVWGGGGGTLKLPSLGPLDSLCLSFLMGGKKTQGNTK